MDKVLPLGVDGAVLADLSPAFYRNGVADPVRLSQVTLTALGGKTYKLALPDPPPSSLCTFAYSYPAGGSGGSGSFDYPENYPATSRVIPLRHAGLTLSDFTLRSFVDGSEETLTWTVAELFPAHDYLISGWPTVAKGRSRVVTWGALGLEGTFNWTESPIPATLTVTRRGMGSWAAGVIKDRASRTGTLRRMNDLEPQAVVLAGGVVTGATTISIKAAGSNRLSGRAVAGSRLDIAGVSGTYIVRDDTDTAPTGTLTVAVTPALTGSASTGAVVTFTQPYADTEYPFLIRKVSDQDQKAVEAGRQTVLLPWDRNLPMPRPNDQFEGIPIILMQLVDADDGPAYYRCQTNNLTGAGANTL